MLFFKYGLYKDCQKRKYWCKTWKQCLTLHLFMWDVPSFLINQWLFRAIQILDFQTQLSFRYEPATHCPDSTFSFYPFKVTLLAMSPDTDEAGAEGNREGRRILASLYVSRTQAQVGMLLLINWLINFRKGR